MKKKPEKRYTIELTEHQLRILDMVCDRYSRLIEGQLELSLQEVCEQAWEKLHKSMRCNDDWYAMRENLKKTLKEMEYTYWGLAGGRYNGIGYDKTADLLWEMHKSMEYAIWDNMDPESKESMRFTVMSDGPMALTGEPFITVKRKED